MRYLPLIAGVLLICAPAKADKFWLSDPAKQAATPGSSPDLIHGVLVAEDDEAYHIRIEGGELVLPKSRVFKVEKDGLTLDAIIKKETGKQKELAQANRERIAAQAEAKAQRDVRIAEASARRRARAVEADAPRIEVAPIQVTPIQPAEFDPVLGVVTGGVSDMDLIRDAEMLWKTTKDRRYLRQLRLLRRLR